MAKFNQFVVTVASKSRSQFIVEHPAPMLTLFSPLDAMEDEWTFNTSTSSMRHVQTLEKEVKLAQDAANYHAFTISKSACSPFQKRISVGRASNNDIALPHRSVSKIHAYVILDEVQATLQDANSRNGTFVDNRRLLSDKATKINSGDILTFGAISLTFLDAGAFYDLMKRHLEPLTFVQ
ncbi:MAG: FHA domain-containing protein [Myxococcota bacterium]